MNQKFYALPEEKKQRIITSGHRILEEQYDHLMTDRLEREKFVPGLDAARAEEGFGRLLKFWRSVYLRKEEAD